MCFNITASAFRISISQIQNRFYLSINFVTVISAFKDFLSFLNWTTILLTASQNTYLFIFVRVFSQYFLNFIVANRFSWNFENNWLMTLVKISVKKEKEIKISKNTAFSYFCIICNVRSSLKTHIHNLTSWKYCTNICSITSAFWFIFFHFHCTCWFESYLSLIYADIVSDWQSVSIKKITYWKENIQEKKEKKIEASTKL